MAYHWRFSSPLWSSYALAQRKVSLGVGMSGEFFFFKSCVGWLSLGIFVWPKGHKGCD